MLHGARHCLDLCFPWVVGSGSLWRLVVYRGMGGVGSPGSQQVSARSSQNGPPLFRDPPACLCAYQGRLVTARKGHECKTSFQLQAATGPFRRPHFASNTCAVVVNCCFWLWQRWYSRRSWLNSSNSKSSKPAQTSTVAQ